MTERIRVEVVYALPDRQWLLAVDVPQGATAQEAVALSGIAALVPGLDPEQAGVGIFGRIEKTPRERVLEDGDRVEIYRPLTRDPKEARRARAEKARAVRQARGAPPAANRPG